MMTEDLNFKEFDKISIAIDVPGFLKHSILMNL